jgi:hypothetical protein
MNQYEVTAKLWVKTTADTPEKAESLAKTIVDEALIEYMQHYTQAPGENISISKSKVIWAKDISPKEGK